LVDLADGAEVCGEPFRVILRWLRIGLREDLLALHERFGLDFLQVSVELELQVLVSDRWIDRDAALLDLGQHRSVPRGTLAHEVVHSLLALLASGLERIPQNLPDLLEDALTDVVQRELVDERPSRDAVTDVERRPIGPDTIVEEVRCQVARVDELTGLMVLELAVESRHLPAQVLLDDDAARRAPVKTGNRVSRGRLEAKVLHVELLALDLDLRRRHRRVNELIHQVSQ
jgi:hypothetical protein